MRSLQFAYGTAAIALAMTTVRRLSIVCLQLKPWATEASSPSIVSVSVKDLNNRLNRVVDPNAQEDQLATPERTSRTKAT